MASDTQSTQTVLVIGATGTQGTAVIQHLLPKGYSIHALVRDPNSDAARALRESSPQVHLFQGDWDNVPAIRAAAASCTALFLNVYPSFTDDSETRHAHNILTATQEAGITQVIYSSAVAIGHQERLPNWSPTHFMAAYARSKQTIQDWVQSMGFARWTILQPSTFMTNFMAPKSARMMFPELLASPHVLRSSYAPDGKIALIDPDDIGRFTAAALNEPARFKGQIIPLVGEKLKAEQIAEAMGNAANTQVKVEFRAAEQANETPFAAGQAMMHEVSEFADVDECKKWNVPLTSFKEFLGERNDLVSEIFGRNA